MNTTTGINFPLEIVNGNLKINSGADLIKGHILSWLQTETKERVMRPNYGLADPLFNSQQDISRIANNILTGLTNYVQDAKFYVSGNLNDNGEAEFTVSWIYQLEESSLTITI